MLALFVFPALSTAVPLMVCKPVVVVVTGDGQVATPDKASEQLNVTVALVALMIPFALGDGTTVAADAQGRVADAATIATAGVQKWHFDGTNWKMVYVLQNGLNIGVPYTITGYPSPATDGCRNIAGEVDDHGIATIYAVTSTISASGDQGADPNKLVMVMDKVNSLTLPVGDGDHDRDDRLGLFTTIRSAGFGEVLRGVALAPADDDDRSFDRDDHGDHDRR